MRRASVAAVAALAIALFSPAASSHKPDWCGHGTIHWSYWSYGNFIEMREVFRYDYMTGGRHRHVVDTQKAVKVQGAIIGWDTVHRHDRDCGSTPA